MNSFNAIAISIAILLFAFVIAWPLINGNDIQNAQSDSLLTEDILGDGSELILPIPRTLPLNPDKVALGEQLFADTLLSGNGFSCATCHPPQHGGMDGIPLSTTTDGGFDVINTPTIFNSGFNSRQLWNGAAASLEQQLDRVINNPKHMASSWPLIMSRLQERKDYRQLFNETYPDGLTRKNITNAITTYERSLTTPDADFDHYLRGDKMAITEQQKRGYLLFQRYGCISCHQGINVGGNLFARFGVYESGLSQKEQLTTYDYGRFNYTNDKSDKFVFRVPSLRNVAKTAPYFHDGSTETLSEAITTMARVQLDVVIPEDDVKAIESFLHSLTGEYRSKAL